MDSLTLKYPCLVQFLYTKASVTIKKRSGLIEKNKAEKRFSLSRDEGHTIVYKKDISSKE